MDTILKIIFALLIWDIFKLILKTVVGVIDLYGYIEGGERARELLKRGDR